jgi:hypothetical protein
MFFKSCKSALLAKILGKSIEKWLHVGVNSLQDNHEFRFRNTNGANGTTSARLLFGYLKKFFTLKIDEIVKSQRNSLSLDGRGLGLWSMVHYSAG